MTPTDAVLALGATLRLTRLVVTDSITGPLVRTPAERWAEGNSAREHLTAGLSCPFCVGFWLGAGVLATHAATGSRGRSVWRFVAAALTLNEVVGHAAIRLGDV